MNSLLILTLTAVCCGLSIWMVLPAPPVGFYWDDTWYLLMAEWLSGRPEHRELAWTMLQLRQYPPLFPFALSISGATLEEQQNAFIMNALFLGVGIGVAMIWFTRQGFAPMTTTLAAAFLMFNPVTLYWMPTLFSEHLFILLTTSALALASLRRDWIPLWLVIGITAGLSVATRSAGWALVPAILVSLILQRRFVPVPFFVFGLTMGVLTIPLFMAGLPPARSYLNGFTEVLAGFGGDYMVQQVKALIEGWHSLWGSMIGALIAAVFILPGLVIRLRKYHPDAWFVMFYIGMLIAWPFPEHMSRFLWPMLPAFMVAGNSTAMLFRDVKKQTIIASVATGVILTASIPNGIAKSIERLRNPPGGELFELSRMPEWTRSSNRKIGTEILQARRQFLNDMEQISEITDNSHCIYSELPSLVTAQTQRVALVSPWKTLDELDFSNIQCPYYYLIPQALPGSDTDKVDRFSTFHRELFRSLAPYDPNGKLLMGAFFELQPQTTD